MNALLENELEDIVNSSRTLQNQDVWRDVALALGKYEKNKMEELRQEIYDSYQMRTDSEWNIHVMLLPLTETLPRDYEYLSDEDEDSALCGYLEGSYEVCKTLYQKEFHGHYTGEDGKVHSITYQLVRSNALLKSEKRICKFASFYHLTVPLIYAPSLRRFVNILTSTEHQFTEREKKTLDLELSQDNDLEMCFRQGVRAVWNVHFSDSLPWEKKEIPIEVFRRTENCYRHACRLNSNEYLWFRAEPLSNYDITMENGNVSVFTAFPVLEDAEKMVIEERKSRVLPEYEFDLTRALPRRIFTEADILDVVKRFRFGSDKRSVLQYEYVAQSAPNDQDLVFCEYERHYQYPEQYPFMEAKGKRHIAQNPLRTIWVIFRNDNSPELYDRIVFVISWLRQQYPEFSWKGGYRR